MCNPNRMDESLAENLLLTSSLVMMPTAMSVMMISIIRPWPDIYKSCLIEKCLFQIAAIMYIRILEFSLPYIRQSINGSMPGGQIPPSQPRPEEAVEELPPNSTSGAFKVPVHGIRDPHAYKLYIYM